MAEEAAGEALGEVVGWLLERAVGEVFAPQQELQSLQLAGVRCTASVLLGACVVFRGLRHVSLRGLVAVTDRVLLALSELHAHTLETLDVVDCARVSDEALTVLAAACARLAALAFSGTSQSGTSDAAVMAACRYICTHTYTLTHTPTHTLTHGYVGRRGDGGVQVHTHTYTHIHTHSHTHARICQTPW